MNLPMVDCVFSSSGYLVGTSYRTIVQVAVPGTLDLSKHHSSKLLASKLVVLLPLEVRQPSFSSPSCFNKNFRFFLRHLFVSVSQILFFFSEKIPVFTFTAIFGTIELPLPKPVFFFRAPGLLPRASKLGQKIIGPVAGG